MRTTRKQLFIGLPLLIAIGLAAFFGLWALNDSGPKDTVMAKGIIEYSVYDASGNLKEHKVIHNVDGLQGHTATSDRLFDETQSSVGANDAFRAVFMTSDSTGETTVGTGIATVTTNPKNDALVDCTTVGITRECVISVPFTANAQAIITQLKLVKGADDTTAVFGDLLGVADIFAFQTVAITLENTDQLTVTWTVTIS